LDPAHFLGGRMTLDLNAARAALETLSQRLGIDTQTTAHGILAIANATIERAVRRVSVERGYDPREFTLVAFGGAGGLHACAVAERLGMRRVFIPRYPGVLCAFGLLVADLTREYSRSLLRVLSDETTQTAAQMIQAMIPQAERDHEVHDQQPLYRPSLDMRYRGQAYELSVPYSTLDTHPSSLTQAFHALHRQTYGFDLPTRPIEVVNVRLQVIYPTEKPVILPEPLIPQHLTGSHFEREHLAPGSQFEGEALVHQMDCTTYIPLGWSARVDAWRNLIVTRSEAI
jgi:N-methylhydantoinase A